MYREKWNCIFTVHFGVRTARLRKLILEGASKYLPYVGCSTSDGKSQTQICIDRSCEEIIQLGFCRLNNPNGEVNLEELARKTACTLPL